MLLGPPKDAVMKWSVAWDVVEQVLSLKISLQLSTLHCQCSRRGSLSLRVSERRKICSYNLLLKMFIIHGKCFWGTCTCTSPTTSNTNYSTMIWIATSQALCNQSFVTIFMIYDWSMILDEFTQKERNFKLQNVDRSKFLLKMIIVQMFKLCIIRYKLFLVMSVCRIWNMSCWDFNLYVLLLILFILKSVDFK